MRLISLQKGVGTEQLAGLPVSVETLGDDFDAGPDAFLDTAAAMQSLDLVITRLARRIWRARWDVPSGWR